MSKKSLILAAALQAIALQGFAQPAPLFHPAPQEKHIFVNNRILAKVNGKAISVIDVMKKMDMMFYRQFPQYSSSTEARFQFYQVNWKQVLEEMVEKELIIADAKENKIEVSNGEVRQELETLFGPNIIANLDKAGLTHEEAMDMIKDDLIIRRMMMIRVNQKAFRAVTPSVIREAYEKFAKENIKPDTWKYQVITIRGEDTEKSREAAGMAHRMLVEELLPIQELKDKVSALPEVDKSTSFNISEVYTHTEKDISEAFKTILFELEPLAYSAPVAQKSRTSKGEVFRIFYLNEKLPGGAPSFTTMEAKIKNFLIEKEMEKETEAYIARIRKHFDVTKENNSKKLPEGFQPFVIQ